MKLLIDMNLSPRWVDFFAAAGIKAVHWSSIGAADTADDAIIDYAAQGGFAVFTHDLDFGTFLAFTHAGRPSVVQLRMADVIPESTAALIMPALQKLSADIEKGALVTIDAHKIRLHLLPL
jgi:predicted nuclease of predicted toxin-antitoxin system